MAECMEQKKKARTSETPIERDGRDSDVDGDEKDDKKVDQIVLERKTTTPGIVYLSRIPPFMKPIKVKQLLSEYGEVGRVFLQPEDPLTRLKRKKFGGNKKRKYTEGWVDGSRIREWLI